MMNQDPQNIKINLERKQRVFFAALSGFIAGTTVAVISSFINTWLFPDLPLYLEWSSIFFVWVLWSVLGGILAGIAGFSSEGWESVLFSAVCMAFTILLLSFVQSSESTTLKLIAIIGLFFPISALMTPLAFLFFWLAQRFVQAVSIKSWGRLKIIFMNIVIILVIGILPGLYAKINGEAEQSMRVIHEILQNAAKASSHDTVHKALLKTEGFVEHQDQSYALSQVSSIYSTSYSPSTDGVDVTAHYDDGYTILCTVVRYPAGSNPIKMYPAESNPSIFISLCKGQVP